MDPPRRELVSSRGVRWYRDLWKDVEWKLLFAPGNTRTDHDPADAPTGHALYELAVIHPARPKKRVKVFVGRVRDYARLGFERPGVFWSLMRSGKATRCGSGSGRRRTTRRTWWT